MLYKKKKMAACGVFGTGFGVHVSLSFTYRSCRILRTAFYDMTAIIEMPGTEWKFIGFENYKKLFTDPDVRTALINSLKMMVLTVILRLESHLCLR